MVKIEELKRGTEIKPSKNELSTSFDENDFEFLDEAVFDDEETSYKSLISKKVLALDFSSNSTYIQLGIGGATGWLTGYLVGKVGKALAAAVGGSILLLNMGARAGYITVDWEKVDTDMRTASETMSRRIAEKQQNHQAERFFEKGSMFVKRNLMTVGGFAAGFFLGIAT